MKASQPHSLNKIERFEVQIALFPYFLSCLASARRDSFKCPEGVRVLSELQSLPSFTGIGVDSSGFPGLKLIESKVSQLPTFLKSPNKTLKSLQGREPKMCCVKDTYYFSLPSEASPNSLVTDLSGPVTQPAPKTSQELFSLELDPEHCLCFRLELWVTSSCCHTAKRPEMERKSLGILKTSSTPALPNVRFHKP